MDEERHREAAREGGHTSHEKGNSHEFGRAAASEAGRKGARARTMTQAARESASASDDRPADEGHGPESGEQRTGREEKSADQDSDNGVPPRAKKTRGGTHDQHVTAGKKGGSRIRQLIELGYKYEEEHGIGPGRNERSKLAAKRRASKASGQGGESQDEAGDMSGGEETTERSETE
jgi:hypothetical protein